MGYKLAGYDVVGNCEIDPQMMGIYRANLHPKHSYLCDIRELVTMDLPEELFDLDILDGSPPCSVFSTAGKREEGWGVEKKFREGQEEQRLDDLFFWYIKVAERLQPKVVIAENVEGLVKGSSKGYVNEILKAFYNAGYKTQIFLLNSAVMGVPQARTRVFFIGQRKDIPAVKISMDFREKPIVFGEVRTEKSEIKPGPEAAKILSRRKHGDKFLSDANERIQGKHSGFTHAVVWDDNVCSTMISGGYIYRGCDAMRFSNLDIVHCQTFPEDYDFGSAQVQYVCGMSVPPVMMANISSQVYEQVLSR